LRTPGTCGSNATRGQPGKEHTVFDDNDAPGSDDDDGGSWTDWFTDDSGPTSWVVFFVLLGLLAFFYFAR
jgi:hypothetical protein